MLFIIILGFIATLRFRQICRAKGHENPRLWYFPLMSAAALMLLTQAFVFLPPILIDDFENSPFRHFGYIFEICALIFYVAITAMMWRYVKRLPRKGGAEAADS